MVVFGQTQSLCVWFWGLCLYICLSFSLPACLPACPPAWLADLLSDLRSVCLTDRDCRCGHCKQLAPKWSKVAESLKGIVKVAAVNCEDDKQLCGKHGWVHPVLIAAHTAPDALAWSLCSLMLLEHLLHQFRSSQQVLSSM